MVTPTTVAPSAGTTDRPPSAAADTRRNRITITLSPSPQLPTPGRAPMAANAASRQNFATARDAAEQLNRIKILQRERRARLLLEHINRANANQHRGSTPPPAIPGDIDAVFRDRVAGATTSPNVTAGTANMGPRPPTQPPTADAVRLQRVMRHNRLAALARQRRAEALPESARERLREIETPPPPYSPRRGALPTLQGQAGSGTPRPVHTAGDVRAPGDVPAVRSGERALAGERNDGGTGYTSANRSRTSGATDPNVRNVSRGRPIDVDSLLCNALDMNGNNSNHVNPNLPPSVLSPHEIHIDSSVTVAPGCPIPGNAQTISDNGVRAACDIARVLKAASDAEVGIGRPVRIRLSVGMKIEGGEDNTTVHGYTVNPQTVNEGRAPADDEAGDPIDSSMPSPPPEGENIFVEAVRREVQRAAQREQEAQSAAAPAANTSAPKNENGRGDNAPTKAQDGVQETPKSNRRRKRKATVERAGEASPPRLRRPGRPSIVIQPLPGSRDDDSPSEYMPSGSEA